VLRRGRCSRLCFPVLYTLCSVLCALCSVLCTLYPVSYAPVLLYSSAPVLLCLCVHPPVPQMAAGGGWVATAMVAALLHSTRSHTLPHGNIQIGMILLPYCVHVHVCVMASSVSSPLPP
jgi:hypothetical protein